MSELSVMIGFMPPIYDDIRKAIEASPKSRYQLWQETGISQAQLSGFMAGNKGLSVEALEELAACLGFEITIRQKNRKSRHKEGQR